MFSSGAGKNKTNKNHTTVSELLWPLIYEF